VTWGSVLAISPIQAVTPERRHAARETGRLARGPKTAGPPRAQKWVTWVKCHENKDGRTARGHSKNTTKTQRGPRSPTEAMQSDVIKQVHAVKNNRFKNPIGIKSWIQKGLQGDICGMQGMNVSEENSHERGKSVRGNTCSRVQVENTSQEGKNSKVVQDRDFQLNEEQKKGT